MTLKEKMEALVEDFGFDFILEDQDLTEEEALEVLFKQGLIDISRYFDEEIENEDE